MTYSPSSEDQSLRVIIQQNLQDIAEQMGYPIAEQAANRLYQEAVNLLGAIAYEPITLARVAGSLLVYQLQKIEAEEVEWFKSQIQQCTDGEEVEELIESLHRTDAL
ncbi:MAG: hypothetical protein Kow00121_48040 [Elainellaceae cyanobacterium]